MINFILVLLDEIIISNEEMHFLDTLNLIKRSIYL